jgi:uncharacterized protein
LILIYCFFVSDLHGDRGKYQKLFQLIAEEKPEAVFIGGDILPFELAPSIYNSQGFIHDYMLPELKKLQQNMPNSFPRILVIMGNDDQRAEEPGIREMEQLGLVEYIHDRKVSVGKFQIYGYAYVPPTPFYLKDWERYDISRYIDPGDISPEAGRYSIPVDERVQKHATIKADIDRLTANDSMDNAIFLFHAPPYRTLIDIGDLEGRKVDGVPLDVHLGSIAIRNFIEARQPLLTLHGHIHESARLSGSWKDRIGRTHIFTAAHDGSHLALISFALENPGEATRRLVP